MKQPLLYLCHRMPYPPNKGDKITTFNILKFLSEHYQVYLGCFIDDPEDKRYIAEVSTFCQNYFFVDIKPNFLKIKSLTAFIKHEPITLTFYRNTPMQDWVNKTITEKKITKIFIYSACMAQYVLHKSMQNLFKVIQFADIDSDKWRQFSLSQNKIMSKIYWREYQLLFKYEKLVANEFNLSCFISDAEVDLFKSMIDTAVHQKIKTLSNGIDCEFFSPNAPSKLNENYDLQKENYIIFTGAMDYQPNIDTVTWFVKNVWPAVIAKLPSAKFYIVGSSPNKKVMQLSLLPGVVVTGKVDDIRPYLQHAKAAVAPMQMARGIQNKILEAMAMALPVLTTKLGAEGLNDCVNQDVYISDSPLSMQNWVIEKLTKPAYSAKDSRAWLKAHYSWQAKLSPLLDYLGA